MKQTVFFSFFLILVLFQSCNREPQLYFTYLHSNPDRDEISNDSVMKLQEAHIKNITRLANEGIILAAGPFNNGGGIFIISASSMHELNEILITDPAIKAGRFRLENHPLQISQGELHKVDTGYTMTFYDFIQTDGTEKKFDFSSEISTASDSLELVARLKFTDSSENILLIKNSSSTVSSDEIIKDLIHPAEIKLSKILWIAKESFEGK